MTWLQAPDFPFLRVFTLENLQLLIFPLYLSDVSAITQKCLSHGPGIYPFEMYHQG